MGSGLSPLDPLFWLHHCNVDRIWAEWQVSGNSTPRFNTDFRAQFYDATGTRLDLAADGSLNSDSLGYAYDTMAAFGGALALAAAAGVDASQAFEPSEAAMVEERLLGSVDVDALLPVDSATSFSIAITRLADTLSETRPVRGVELPSVAAIQSFGGKPEEALSRFGKPRDIRKRVYAVVRNPRAESVLAATVNVFLNCPYLSRGTPYTDEHYAGGFSFFGGHGDGGHADGHSDGSDHVPVKDVWIDITDAIERLGLSNEAALQVQLFPAAEGNPNLGSVRCESIRVVSA